MFNILIWVASVSAIISLILSISCNWTKISGLYFKVTNSRDWKIYFLRLKYEKLLKQFDAIRNEDKKYIFYKMALGRIEDFFFDNHVLLTVEELNKIKSVLKNPKTISFVVDNNCKEILSIKEFCPYEYNFSEKNYIKKPVYKVPVINTEMLQQNYPNCVKENTVSLEEFGKIK